MRPACRWCVFWSALFVAVCTSSTKKADKKEKLVIGRHPRQTDGVGFEGVWGPWSQWTECSQSCGVGVSERQRQCMPPPQTWNEQTYLSSGVLSNTPLFPPHSRYYSQPYPRNDRPQFYPGSQSPGLPLYRDTPEARDTPRPEQPNQGSLYRPDFRLASQQPASIYRSPSSSSSPSYVQPGRISRRPTNQGSRRVGADGSRRQIRPGQFGYGRVPFSIPLHRQTRHTHLHDNSTIKQVLDLSSPDSEAMDKTQDNIGAKEQNRHKKTKQRHRSIVRRAPPPVPPPFSRPLHRPDTLPDTPLYHPPAMTPGSQYRCAGRDREVRICRQQACAVLPSDPRAEQCAAFNDKEFMGRIYDWEPFTEGSLEQQCELTCRPVGYRFYVRHSERVRDGTPCTNNTPNDMCVGGRCLTEGCDGILGSGLVRDRCGVCDGSDGSCIRVSGSFQNSSIPPGYHKILNIPAGATAINITERRPSPNYLALRSGTGKSIVNGHWAVDPPGEYEAGGTKFHYTRDPAETLRAPGPTHTVLHLYIIFHKENPGIDYEYYIPAQKDSMSEGDRGNSPLRETIAVVVQDPDPLPDFPPSSSLPDGWTPDRPQPRSSASNRNARIPPRTDIPLDNHSPFEWRLGHLTECTASCGKGSQYRKVVCVNRHTNEEVHDRRCDSSSKPSSEEVPCNVQPCPPYWEVGAWSECSVSCGWGLQHRQLQCRQSFSNRSTRVQPQRCASQTQPNITQPCHIQSCTQWQIASSWSTCSVDCGKGKRTRNVRCVSDQGSIVSDGECNERQRPQGTEDCHMGPCVSNWYFSDWMNTCSAPCGPGVKRREVVCVSSGAEGECVKEKPADMTSCNSGPCTAYTLWFTGPWGQCSSRCGNGTQRRDIVCVQKLETDFSVMPAADCAHLDRPSPIQTCEVGPCTPQWYTTEWSACSKSCGEGVQTRDIRCLTPDKHPSSTCDATSRPQSEQSCNHAPCNGNTLDESCKDRRANCMMVVQARLCVYTYYKSICCASCAQSAQRAKRH